MSIKDFQIISRLGEGSYSSVWKCKRLSDGKEYAMKKVKMNSLSAKEKENALNEVRILASISSPFIIGYKEAFFDDNSMTLCIVMELAAGDIYNKIQSHTKKRTYFPEAEIWSAFVQMTKGLKILHDNKILHRDLKCANVFMSLDNTAKLGDLNVSKVAKSALVYTQTGTPYYASPEVWGDKPYDAKSDIWSLGCVVYEMAALKPPFRANDMQGLYKKIQKGIFDKIPSQYSQELTQMITFCLQVSPSQRPSCDQLLNNPIMIRQGRMGTPHDEPNAMDLLGTIKMPRNPRALAGQLPKANYQSASVELDKVVPPKQVAERVTSAQSRRPNINPNSNPNPNSNIKPPSRDGMARDDALIKAQNDLLDKGRVVSGKPGLPPRREIDIKRPSPVNPNQGTPKNDYGHYDPLGGNNNGRNSRDGNRPPSNISRERSYSSKQDDIISKYQRIDPKIQQVNKYESPNSYRRLYSDNPQDKRADYLLQKYNPGQYGQKPPTPNHMRANNENQDLVMKYNNIYSAKQANGLYRNDNVMLPNKIAASSPYLKPDYQYANRNAGIYESNQNHLRNSPAANKPQNRPIWWG